MTQISTKNRKLRVVIIDDDEVSNFIYKKIISASNIAKSIDAFLRGQDALDHLEAQIGNDSFPDLIFLDINMPVMDGWEVLNRYTKDICPLLVQKPTLCMLSSSVYQADIDKALAYKQVAEYIPKPLTHDQILSIVEKYF